MQKAELELPVKQFHQLYDLLEDIRTELFNQIPDEEPTEITYAFTTAINAHQITPLKLYKIKRCSDHGSGFLITNDRRSEVYCIENGCSHLSSDQSENWYLATVTNK